MSIGHAVSRQPLRSRCMTPRRRPSSDIRHNSSMSPRLSWPRPGSQSRQSQPEPQWRMPCLLRASFCASYFSFHRVVQHPTVGTIGPRSRDRSGGQPSIPPQVTCRPEARCATTDVCACRTVRPQETVWRAVVSYPTSRMENSRYAHESIQRCVDSTTQPLGTRKTA
jgi:hypothetical protein